MTEEKAQVVEGKGKKVWFWLAIGAIVLFLFYSAWENAEKIKAFFKSTEFAILAIILVALAVFFLVRKVRTGVISSMKVRDLAIKYYLENVPTRMGVDVTKNADGSENRKEVQYVPDKRNNTVQYVEPDKYAVYLRNVFFGCVYDIPSHEFVSHYDNFTEVQFRQIVSDLCLDPRTREEIRLRTVQNEQ